MSKIVPSVEDLLNPVPKDFEKCLLCGKVLHGKAALASHLLRSHKVSKKNDSVKAYYCPSESCCHSISSSQPFSTFAAIKQHYNLVHTEARFKCSRCSRSFKAKHSCREHEADCGIKFVCSCNVAYTSKRGLLEHTKRQSHEIPQSLKSLFEAKKKHRKNTRISATAQAKRTPVSTKFILPKTWKKKIRLLSAAPDQMPQLQKQLLHTTETNKLKSSNSKPLATNLIPLQAKEIKTSSQQNSVSSQCLPSPQQQFPLQSQNSCLLREEKGASVAKNTDWLHKNISIQTEENLGSSSWITLEDEVEKILFENIATQTSESIFEQTATETDSTMCQTESRPQTVTDPSFLYSAYNNYCPDQANYLCDAQMQTVADQTYDLLKRTAPYQMNSQDVYSVDQYPSTANRFASITPSMNIETQTDKIVHQSSTETQTVEQLLYDNYQVTALSTADAEMSTLDVFLNNIETQTDVLLSPWSEHQIATFAHSCTQTTDPDFFSEILDLDAQHRM